MERRARRLFFFFAMVALFNALTSCDGGRFFLVNAYTNAQKGLYSLHGFGVALQCVGAFFNDHIGTLVVFGDDSEFVGLTTGQAVFNMLQAAM